MKKVLIAILMAMLVMAGCSSASGNANAAIGVARYSGAVEMDW